MLRCFPVRPITEVAQKRAVQSCFPFSLYSEILQNACDDDVDIPPTTLAACLSGLAVTRTISIDIGLPYLFSGRRVESELIAAQAAVRPEDVRLLIAVEDAVRVELEAIAWRDGLKRD